jgi:hypothetical protein
MSTTRISLHIGINGYPAAIGSLQFCVADAVAVRNILDAHREGFHSTISVLLADGPVKGSGDALPPTRANIISKVKQVCEQATDQDTLLVQFSGHGALSTEGRLYLLPLDIVPGTVEDTGIAWQWLIDKVERSPAPKKIVIIDACHSGAGRDVQLPSKATAAIIAEVERSCGGFVCLSSCSAGELAYELTDLGHGIFSYYLVSGITGAADPLRRGVVDIASLYAFVRDRTVQEAKQLGASQHPHLISKIATSLEAFVLTAMPLERAINRVLVCSEDPVLGHMLRAAVSRSHEVREAVWKDDIQLEIGYAEHRFDYTAVYIDVGSDWPNKKKFITLVRRKYPIVPFVLLGAREAFLGSLEEQDKRRFEHYFFFDTGMPISMVPSMVAETLAQIGWDITKRYGEKVQD